MQIKIQKLSLALGIFAQFWRCFIVIIPHISIKCFIWARNNSRSVFDDPFYGHENFYQDIKIEILLVFLYHEGLEKRGGGLCGGARETREPRVTIGWLLLNENIF